jgi:ubiquinone/menaquinone biosynthesis C-methylase UbiE
MPGPRGPHKKKQEIPSTYFVQDRSNKEELIRLDKQDRLITALMGGLLPEQEDADRLQSVLDVACGPGGWLIDLARTYPGIAQLVGVDISERMITYARGQAKAAQLNSRVRFQVSDALHMSKLPAESFDLVHQRLGMSFLRTWEWPELLSEYLRVCKPGGIIHITETALLPETNSPALKRLVELLIEALYCAGHFFTPESEGVTSHLAAMMRQYGIVQVQTKVYALDYHTNAETLQAYAENVQRLFRTGLPFMRKWIKLPPDYQDLYRQMMDEIQRPDFVSTNLLTTAWGSKNEIL